MQLTLESEINGILGMDFLTETGAIINLRGLSIEFSDDQSA